MSSRKTSFPRLCKFQLTLVGAALAVLPTLAFGALTNKELSTCGTTYAPPFGNRADATPRSCQSGTRQYRARNTGIGFKILDIDSEVCFVPDSSYALLDTLVDQVVAAVQTKPSGKSAFDQQALVSLNTLIGDTLAKHNFGLHIPTITLADALAARNSAGEPERHLIDCDTASMIYLTVAHRLNLQASLVEITLKSGSGHNYVRWQLAGGGHLDWDTNGREQCVTPAGLASYEGKAMSESQVLGYVYGVRGSQQGKRGNFFAAVADFRRSGSMYPESPGSANNFAWMIATKSFPGRAALMDEAISNAEKAIKIERSANNLDTYACVLAATSKFADAVAIATEVVAIDDKEEFKERLSRLKAGQDCVGVE
jgi:hypothetical protein